MGQYIASIALALTCPSFDSAALTASYLIVTELSKTTKPLQGSDDAVEIESIGIFGGDNERDVHFGFRAGSSVTISCRPGITNIDQFKHTFNTGDSTLSLETESSFHINGTHQIVRYTVLKFVKYALTSQDSFPSAAPTAQFDSLAERMAFGSTEQERLLNSLYRLRGADRIAILFLAGGRQSN